MHVIRMLRRIVNYLGLGTALKEAEKNERINALSYWVLPLMKVILA